MDLASRYEALNDAFFDGRLPPVAFRLSSRMTSTAGQWDARRGEIAVATAFVEAHPDRVDELLLHEMVHVATRSGHGPPFRREWQRLKVAGAPVSHVYREFRHCPQFAPGRPRPYLYRCPQCDAEFPRTRPFREPRWCASCERAARRRGQSAFAPERRLVPA